LKILKNINWEINNGENWAVLGPNGAGKSTLVKLILGDHPQAFANDIKVFGKKIGANNSIWDLKKKIGLISNDLLYKHNKLITVMEVLYSSFFDSIGLYQKPNLNQINETKSWIQKFNLEDLADKRFDELSFGQKKIILIARALIKSPKLLILDEPLHGLDQINRQRVLNLINLTAKSDTNITYITHNEEELIPAINRKLYLKRGEVAALV
jgi:molybdate transport system ATP-binding protein